MKRSALLVFTLTSLLLGACSGESGGNDAAGVISAYLNAVVSQDQTTAASLSCAAWEASAATEVHSFDGVTARLEDLACTAGVAEDGGTPVNCTGRIIATYQGEDRPIELDGLTYLAVQEGGEWRMCGYK